MNGPAADPVQPSRISVDPDFALPCFERCVAGVPHPTRPGEFQLTLASEKENDFDYQNNDYEYFEHKAPRLVKLVDHELIELARRSQLFFHQTAIVRNAHARRRQTR